ncbi:MAG: DUF134 domain-containing protein [Candidatus Helarchaeota archaeon]
MNPRGKGRRHGRGRMHGPKGPGRPISFKNVKEPIFKQFLPVVPSNLIEEVNKEPIFLYYDELEAMKLVDHENITQEQAGVRMQVSRGTIWRLVQSARSKILSSILEGRPLYIIPREY